MNVQVV